MTLTWPSSSNRIFRKLIVIAEMLTIGRDVSILRFLILSPRTGDSTCVHRTFVRRFQCYSSWLGLG